MATIPDTTVTPALLAPRLGAAEVTPEVTRIFNLAKAEVEDAFKDAWRDVPVAHVDECVYRVGRAIKDATNKAATGAGQVTATEAVPLRAPADCRASAYPIIRRYVVLGL